MSVFTSTIPKLVIMQKSTLKTSLIITQSLCAIFCALTAFGSMFGAISPIAISFAAAVPSSYALSASIGAAIGHAIAMPMDVSMPYLICILVLGAFRTFYFINKFKLSENLPIFALVASITFFISSVFSIYFAGRSFADLMMVIAETLTIFGFAYLLKFALNTPWQNIGIIGIHGKASLILLVVCVLISLGSYSIFELKLIHVIGASVALTGAICGREYSGSLMGIAVSAALVIADFSSLYAGFAISLAALIAGFFLQENRFICAIVFIITCILGVPLADTPLEGLIFLIEVSLGCAIVMALPARLFLRIPVNNSVYIGRSSLTVLSGRLQNISAALSNVGTILNNVCEKMPKYGETYSDICDAVTQAVCEKCPKNTDCWGNGDGAIYDALNNMHTILKARGYVVPADIPEPLKSNCKFPKKLTSALSTGYRMGLQKRFAAARNRTTRAALTEQYNAMAAALAQLSTQVYREEMPDKRKEAKVEQLFYSMGVEPMEISVSSDSNGCTHVNVQIPRMIFTESELSMLTRELSIICRCKLNMPINQNMYATTCMCFSQQHMFKPIFGAFTLPAKADDVSADVCKTFNDYQGCAHAILCDGMGTGQQAAIDGNLAAALSEKLMVAGFAANEAARLVNVALSLKSDDDTGATLDAFSVNLYTGKAQIFKAGASASFLVRQNVVTVLDGESLPIGILGKVTGRSSNMQLQVGDIIVLLSDGVMSMGKQRICALLSSAADIHPKTIAKRMVEEARKKSTRPDDITVICLALEKFA